MAATSTYTLHLIAEGYSENLEGGTKMRANCSCTLIKGPKNIIVDTMTAWDKALILQKLQGFNVSPDDISYVISTHGHSDHLGCNNLFLNAMHIVGHSISHKDIYFLHSFETDGQYDIDDFIHVLATPGHTLQDVTVIAHTQNLGCVGVVGDLFEREEDIEDPNIWINAGSDSTNDQRKHRSAVAHVVDWIVPGHGPMFKVTDKLRAVLHQQLS